MLSIALFATSFFNMPPTVPVGNQRVSLHGSGPPVVFSSGLFGLMPRRLYTSLFRELETDLTLVVLDDVAPVTVDVVEKISDALGVDQVGFLSHSSFDGRILESPRVGSVVLCDPVTMPTMGAGLQLEKKRVESPSLDALVIKAEHSYDGEDGPPIPEYLLPDMLSSRELMFPGVGHADVLDEPWGDVAVRTFPFMSGVRPAKTRFADWSFQRKDPTKLRAARGEYRGKLGAAIKRHFLKRPNMEVLPNASSA